MSGWNSYNGLNFIGLENYIRLFTDDPRFWESFFRLSFLSVTTVILQYVIGFALAHMVWKEIKFQRFFRVLFLIPMMTTPVIMTVIWRTFFHESLGPVNDILSNFGMSPKWLTDPVLAKVTVIIVEVWQWTPFMFLLLLAGLLSLPKEKKRAFRSCHVFSDKRSVEWQYLQKCYFQNVTTLHKQTNCRKQIPALNSNKQTNKNLVVNNPCTAVFVFDNLGAPPSLGTAIQLFIVDTVYIFPAQLSWVKLT